MGANLNKSQGSPVPDPVCATIRRILWGRFADRPYLTIFLVKSMIFKKQRTSATIISVALTLLLFVTACGGSSKQASRWDSAQRQSTEQVNTSRSSGAQVLPGSAFNRFFPPSGNGFERVYTQEKQGSALAKLKQGGKEIAVLSITDTANNPKAAEKFQNSTKQVAGYPAYSLTPKDTAILVADRFQVKIQSRDDSFTPGDREAWLQKFNLNGLAGLK